VLTLRAAAQLLANATGVASLRPLAALLGASGTPRPVRAALRREMGLAGLTGRTQLVPGAGAFRVLIAELEPATDVGPDTDVRERTRRVGAALLRYGPAMYWAIVAVDLRQLCVATVSPGDGGPRLAVLRVDRSRVLDSDAETLRALAEVNETDDVLRHARLTDMLRREALGLRFYRALDSAVARLADSLPSTGASRSERRELALLCASRCLFLAFLEAKGWMDARRDFLLHHTLHALESGGRLHDRLLRPLFFGTLNTPVDKRAPHARRFGAVPFLNGGLFSPTPLEQRYRALRFGDDAITGLVTGVIDRHRFTAREDSVAWSEAAVDPEMLGRAFEGLMAADERRASGAFYTPPQLVAHAVQQAFEVTFGVNPDLGRLLETRQPDTAAASLNDARCESLRAQLGQYRVLDPDCGSGAFLVHVLERLDALHALLRDPRDTHTRRRAILAQSIFGVDRNPMAVWLCELRLWLSVVIECPETAMERIPPLPNLDHHIRVGDALKGGAFAFAPPSARTLTRLRERYTRASGGRKQRLARSLDREERSRAIAELARQADAVDRERRELLTALRGRDLFGERRPAFRNQRARLQELRASARALRLQRNALQLGSALPFRFGAMFADVAARGGFTLVVSNPPWVRPHAIPSHERERLRTEFRTMRDAAWRQGAARAGAGHGFAAQSDLSVAFVERSLQLLAPGGTMALIVPAKLWRTLSGGGVRRLLLERSTLRVVHDWSDAPAQFDAATYPSLVVASRPHAVTGPAAHNSPPADGTVRISITRRRTVCFERPVHLLSLDHDVGAPWILLPAAAFQAFSLLQQAGPPLASTTLGRPLLGVKCGCNAAFLVHAVEHDDHAATVSALDAAVRQGVIERTLLRPALRGESIGRSGAESIGEASHVQCEAPPSANHAADLRILWTHGVDGQPLRTLPPATARWLAHWRPRLTARRDARRGQPWWTLFRTDAARADTPRVVWADIGRQLRSQVLDAGDPTVPLNSCYVIRTPSIDAAWALHALLTSTVARAWLDAIAEPARGGFRRYLGWTVAALPTPRDWTRAVRLLAPLGQRVTHPDHDQSRLDAAVLHAYDVSHDAVAPLLAWYDADRYHARATLPQEHQP